MVAADQMAVEALIFLGYPLHAPGRTDKLRDSHLYEIKKQMLFFAGTRDPLCNLEKLREVLQRMPGLYDLEIVNGGDHFFKLPKSSSKPAEFVYQQSGKECLQWLDRVTKKNRGKMLFKKERREILTHLFNWCAAFLLASSLPFKRAFAGQNVDRQGTDMKLPKEKTEGTVSVEDAIDQRRTVRKFRSKPLALLQLSRLLWAGQGITGKSGFKRAAPSAGALYPMDLYVVVGKDAVAKIEAGIYHYKPQKHELSLVVGGDLRKAVSRASLSQMWMADAQVSFVITAEYSRTTVKYGKRGVRYAMIEAGHIGQNLFLQAEAMGLKTGIVGAFQDNKVIRVMNIPYTHEPLLIMPIGYPA